MDGSLILCNAQIVKYQAQGGYKRLFLSCVFTMSQYKATENVPGKFKREILAEAKDLPLCTTDRYYQVSEEHLTFAKILKREKLHSVRFLNNFFFKFNIVDEYIASIYFLGHVTRASREFALHVK